MHTLLWKLAARIASLRRARITPADVRAMDTPSQVRGRGLRWTERLRDRLRGNWLRLPREGSRTDDSD